MTNSSRFSCLCRATVQAAELDGQLRGPVDCRLVVEPTPLLRRTHWHRLPSRLWRLQRRSHLQSFAGNLSPSIGGGTGPNCRHSGTRIGDWSRPLGSNLPLSRTPECRFRKWPRQLCPVTGRVPRMLTGYVPCFPKQIAGNTLGSSTWPLCCFLSFFEIHFINGATLLFPFPRLV